MLTRESRIQLQPRGLSRELAAAYVGFSPNKFDELVKEGVMPKPRRSGRRLIFDRYELDEAFDALPIDGQPGESNQWDARYGSNRDAS